MVDKLTSVFLHHLMALFIVGFGHLCFYKIYIVDKCSIIHGS